MINLFDKIDKAKVLEGHCKSLMDISKLEDVDNTTSELLIELHNKLHREMFSLRN